MQTSEARNDAAEAARSALVDSRRRQLLNAAAHLLGGAGSQSVSMQNVADEAGVSVGLIYRYFGNKQELVQAVIEDVLHEFSVRVASATADQADPVRRIAAAFAGYCAVVQELREAAVLAYQESKTLEPEGRETIKNLEVESAGPLIAAARDAFDAGLIRDVNLQVFAYGLLTTAHLWALKHWYFGRFMTHEQYVAEHTALALSSVIRPEHRAAYADLLGNLA
ncbi:TetR/AcrR family transcriptional regulator [Sinomonas sp. ASV486]|uniref:TetR/AcrR family transcriptional regulator n=1 Tax=Sinomonas sp. ASV486 TaxID=3051170 RepID=UPI0027DDC945|nr:TetR/AcrR family transcriptional regulator [Sinomonas sp. ASV486]MDQ4491361.1 TetR/AcrR family transcriptional regulator [Sinomonas sp. ASV486]